MAGGGDVIASLAMGGYTKGPRPEIVKNWLKLNSALGYCSAATITRFGASRGRLS